ncbi:MAG: hypothetical protein EOP84_25235 [Verrucomicrobiaceae bacterium]|nr:MAG: hypothetical protein EOP84_25235 [Verrucomicrobiaceae bacterium]
MSKVDSGKRNEERVLIALLPEMLRARIEGRPEPLPPGSGNRQMGALFTAAELTKKGHTPAAEYFLRCVIAGTEKTLEHYDSAVERNLRALATLPEAQWPAVDYSKARVPLLADCLRYIHRDSPVPDSLKRRIASRRWNALSDFALTACTAQRDRTVAPLITKRFARERDPLPADALVSYYKAVGIPSDIPLLGRYAQRLYPDRSKETDDWLGLVRQDVESAILTIRLKELLADPGTDTLRR